MAEKEQSGRRKVAIWFLVILGLAIGLVIRNMKAGLLIGLILGLLGGSLAARR
jgi:hypothetical protein